MICCSIKSLWRFSRPRKAGMLVSMALERPKGRCNAYIKIVFLSNGSGSWP